VCNSPNTCFLGLTRVLKPNSISIGSAIFAQLTEHRSYTSQWSALPLKTAASNGDLDPHLIHGSLGPSPQPKWNLDRFTGFCTAQSRVSLYFTMGCSFPPQNCLFLKQEMIRWQVASAGPHANHLRLAPDRQPCQHLITRFFTGPDGLPDTKTSVTALKTTSFTCRQPIKTK